MAGLGKIFTMSCPQSNIEDPTSILSSHPTISSPQYITSTCNQPIRGVFSNLSMLLYPVPHASCTLLRSSLKYLMEGVRKGLVSKEDFAASARAHQAAALWSVTIFHIGMR
eukprot:scaffold6441_cov128-Skeletonema_marinoi.AAC.2